MRSGRECPLNWLKILNRNYCLGEFQFFWKNIFSSFELLYPYMKFFKPVGGREDVGRGVIQNELTIFILGKVNATNTNT